VTPDVTRSFSQCYTTRQGAPRASPAKINFSRVFSTETPIHPQLVWNLARHVLSLKQQQIVEAADGDSHQQPSPIATDDDRTGHKRVTELHGGD